MTENTAIESLKRALKEAREAKKQTEAKLSDIRAQIAELQEEESKLLAQLPKLNKVIEQTGAAYRVILQNELFPEDEEVFERPARREEPRHEAPRRGEVRREKPRREDQRREEMPARYAQPSGSYQSGAPTHQPPAMPDYDIPAARSYPMPSAEANESADLAAIESGIAEQKLYQSAGNVRFNDFRIPQAATIVLREAGRPLHVTEIYRRMADGGFEFRGQHQLITLAVSLSRAKRFRKVAPGTFELDPKYLSGQVA